MRTLALAAVAAVFVSGAAEAAVFTFDTDPFAGSTAPATPGRQIVGGEPSITFNIATDQFRFDPGVFGVGAVVFANDIAANLATSGLTVVVLRDFDNDNNTATAFGAGAAANLIADRITTPGAGFFVYFNSGLDLARLVFSTDLSDNTADLKILARLTNVAGQAGRDAFPSFSAQNFAATPLPPAAALFAAPLLVAWRRRRALKTASA